MGIFSISDLAWGLVSLATNQWCGKKATFHLWYHWCGTLWRSLLEVGLKYQGQKWYGFLAQKLLSILCLYFFARLYLRVCSEVSHKSIQLGNISDIQFMSTVHIFFLSLLNLKAGKHSLDIATSTVLLRTPQTSGWIVSNPEILYLSTLSQYLSVSILLCGREGVLFSTLIIWSLNRDCQQLAARFSLFTVLFLLQWRE